MYFLKIKTMKRRWKKRGLHWMVGLCMVSVLLLTESCFSTPFQNRKTTVFGTVKNEMNQPIEGVPVVLRGEKGILGSQTQELTRVETNNQGEYSLTTDIQKEFHSGQVMLEPSILFGKYEGESIYINGQKTKDCCLVVVGQKTQYDWVLRRK
jgi:hypothetical protein